MLKSTRLSPKYTSGAFHIARIYNGEKMHLVSHNPSCCRFVAETASVQSTSRHWTIPRVESWENHR